MSKHYDKALDNRLAAAQGHIGAIRRMMEEDKSCSEILLQLSAAESAINKVARIVLKEHLNHCVRDAVKSGDDSAISDFSDILEKYL